MDGLMQTLQIFATMGSASAVYVMLKQSSKKDIQLLTDEIKEVKGEFKDLRNDINKEMKDFHGRLCTLEEKYQNLHEKIDSR